MPSQTWMATVRRRSNAVYGALFAASRNKKDRQERQHRRGTTKRTATNAYAQRGMTKRTKRTKRNEHTDEATEQLHNPGLVCGSLLHRIAGSRGSVLRQEPQACSPCCSQAKTSNSSPSHNTFGICLVWRRSNTSSTNQSIQLSF